MSWALLWGPGVVAVRARRTGSWAEPGWWDAARALQPTERRRRLDKREGAGVLKGRGGWRRGAGKGGGGRGRGRQRLRESEFVKVKLPIRHLRVGGEIGRAHV